MAFRRSTVRSRSAPPSCSPFSISGTAIGHAGLRRFLSPVVPLRDLRLRTDARDGPRGRGERPRLARVRVGAQRAFVPRAARSCRRGRRARADGYVILDYVNREAASFGRRVRGGSDNPGCRTARSERRVTVGGPRRGPPARGVPSRPPRSSRSEETAPKAAPRGALTTRQSSGDDRDRRSAARTVAFPRCTGRAARVEGPVIEPGC
jgi:hypothetical protein